MEDGSPAQPTPVATVPPSRWWNGPEAPAALVVTAGIVHLVLVGDHLAHAIGAGLFFAGLGIAQIAWGAAYLRAPTANLRRIGLAGMAVAPTVLYLVTRLIRAPWSDAPEAWDVIGLATVAVQVVAAALLLPRGWSPLRLDGAAAVGVGLLLATGGYGAALAAEDVPWLSEPRSLHGHGDSHEEDHGAEAHGAGGHAGHGTTLVGVRGQSMVGSTAYYGPATGPEILQYCDAAGHPGQDCWLHYLTDLLLAEGSIAAFAALEELANSDVQADRLGHVVAHSLGHAAYQAYGLDVQVALQECSYEVFQGCIHGVLQAHFADLAAQGKPLDRAALDAICSYGQTSFETYACLHGLGHGIMMYEGGDLLEALDRCALLSGKRARGDCYGGVYMENIVGYFASISGQADAHGDEEPEYWIDADDPAYPCNIVKDSYQPYCWRMQTSLILHFNGADFEAASAVCDQAGEHHLECYDSLGRDSVPYSNRDPLLMSQKCSYGNIEQQERCVRAFTVGVILHFNDPEQGLNICPPLPDHHKDACYRAIGRQASRMLATEPARAVCERAEPDYVQSCLDSAS